MFFSFSSIENHNSSLKVSEIESQQCTSFILCTAFIFSRLYYCSTVWSNTTKENVKKLQLIQNFACRIVLGLKKYDHITEGLKSLNWLNVNDRLLVNDLLMVHKCIHGLIPNYLTGKFIQRSKIHGRNTRGSGELDLPICRLKTGLRSFTFRGAKLYNSLPKYVCMYVCRCICGGRQLIKVK